MTPLALLDRTASLLLCVAAGILCFCAFPNWDFHWFAWFAFVPLLLAARDASPGRGFLYGWLAGTVTNAGGFHWMTEMLRDFGHMPAVAAWSILGIQAVTQGLAMAIGVALWRWLVRRGAPPALSAFLALWGGEALVPMIFPWYLGNAISAELPMIQIADLGGVHLVSALLYAANAALAEILLAPIGRRMPSWRFLGFVSLFALATWGYGELRIPQVDAEQKAAPAMKIGMVEGNIGIWEKEAKYLEPGMRAKTLRHNLLLHQQMSADLDKRGAELIIWPESSYQPFGASPVLHTRDHFLAVGAGGAIWRLGDELTTESADRLGLPRDIGMLSGLSSPRGDIWRAIDGGKRIVTVTPKGTQTTVLPAGETAVATTLPPVDLYGNFTSGLVIARSGRAWQLDVEGYPPTGSDDKPVAKVGPPPLREVAGTAGAVDLTAAAVNGAGRTVAVGRGGAMVEVSDAGVKRIAAKTDADLWTIAADSQGALFVAAGAGGAIVLGDGDRWVASHLDGGDFYAAWFDSSGTVWLAGSKGLLYVRHPEHPWQRQPAVAPVDLLAGSADADGDQLIAGRGGKLFLKKKDKDFAEINAGARGEITSILGFQPQASYLTPRTALRIVPSTARLPDPKLKFPADVEADDETSEFDRSSPRRGFKAPLLFGAMTHGGPLPTRNSACTDCFNSALLLDGDGNVKALYDKTFLLMFGEYIPFGERFPKLYDLSPETSRFQPGLRTEPITVGKARMGMLICYEDLVPRYAKRVAAHNPNVLVNLTNDAWFGKTAEPYHHLNLALMRTVEYRRWLLRSTNTGVSVFIDAVGRRVAETSLEGAETLLQAVPLLEGRTLYALLGDWALVVLAAALALVAARTFRTPAAAARPKKPKKAKPKAKKAEAETLEPARLK